jgi:uncharacterized SAM-binding protein YcdF (DUF218 family)
MFFILSKALLFLISPFSWLVISFFVYLFAKREKLKRIAKYTALFVFLFFSNSFIFLEFMRKWEIHGTKIEDTKSYDVGIVLGGMAEYNSDLDALSIRRHADRIWQALSLYHAGKIKKILISGDSGYVTDHGLKEAKQMKETLVAWGIPETDIITEEISKNTHENALESAKILKESYPHLKSVLLITSGMHMRRSLACFDKVGLRCDPFSTDLFTGPERHYYWDQYIIPDQGSFGEWNKLLKEWIGFFVYDVVGYI